MHIYTHTHLYVTGFPLHIVTKVCSTLRQKAVSPLQNEWRVGLPISWIVHMDGVARVSSKLAKSTLAAAHALGQAAAGARSPQGEGSVVSMPHHQRV